MEYYRTYTKQLCVCVKFRFDVDVKGGNWLADAI